MKPWKSSNSPRSWEEIGAFQSGPGAYTVSILSMRDAYDNPAKKSAEQLKWISRMTQLPNIYRNNSWFTQ